MERVGFGSVLKFYKIFIRCLLVRGVGGEVDEVFFFFLAYFLVLGFLLWNVSIFSWERWCVIIVGFIIIGFFIVCIVFLV